ncbi:MAG: phosphohistidine phosphatase SixA [Thermonema sp.]|uniref:SixA phosphatase family protein n=1 Tax=Thermonema TaxID=28194 RepID=UPI00056F5D83|nr:MULTISPECIES: histidine phosphatase family protein [Thermonema]GIV39146.1 MAG: phosphohistidine phosphatase SixA [Thermonema sp.]
MKYLYLIRHAKSSWKEPLLPDFQRPLKKRGIRDAKFMGKWLKRNKHIPDIIISSPAVRARQTAELLAEQMDMPLTRLHFDESIYEAHLADLLSIVNNQKAEMKAMALIGHNPVLTDFANLLTQNVHLQNIPTCGIWAVQFRVEHWQDIQEDSGQFLFFEYPKKHYEKL